MYPFFPSLCFLSCVTCEIGTRYKKECVKRLDLWDCTENWKSGFLASPPLTFLLLSDYGESIQPERLDV